MAIKLKLEILFPKKYDEKYILEQKRIKKEIMKKYGEEDGSEYWRREEWRKINHLAIADYEREKFLSVGKLSWGTLHGDIYLEKDEEKVIGQEHFGDWIISNLGELLGVVENIIDDKEIEMTMMEQAEPLFFVPKDRQNVEIIGKEQGTNRILYSTVIKRKEFYHAVIAACEELIQELTAKYPNTKNSEIIKKLNESLESTKQKLKEAGI